MSVQAPSIAPDVLAERLAGELGIAPWQAARTIELLDAGNTIPFIARYRKERTGGLDEEVLRRLQHRLRYLRALEARREEVRALLAGQNKLTTELEEALAAAGSLQQLEDLYRPFRPRRRTRAQIAREKGLEPLAEWLLGLSWPEGVGAGVTPESLALAFVNPDAGVPGPDEALAGAADIAAEVIADDPEVRGNVRAMAERQGTIVSIADPEEAEAQSAEEFETYAGFSCPLNRVRPYQILALNRGERLKVLKVRVDIPEQAALDIIAATWRRRVAVPAARNDAIAAWRSRAMADGFRRLLAPSLERELRNTLTERAEEHAIGVFAANLRQLLMQPPIHGHTVLGIDPGYRTGCKVAVTDPTGRVLATETIYPHPPRKQWEEARQTLTALIDRHGVTLIAIGNGTASRETERLVAEITRCRGGLHYLIVNEAGASVYSASPLAREELPDLDVSMRGAVSIARRVQDPLAELVKIDPRSIGVGLYQHDVDQKRLAEALGAVVESCVNRVGVDLNTASAALLEHVAGLSARLAKAIVAHREKFGPFRNRRQLLEVPGLGPKTFEQCAGFLRIRSGDQPLDGTAVHPESYHLAAKILESVGASVDDLIDPRRLQRLQEKLAGFEPLQLVARLGAGEPTVRDIVEDLARPGRDPREDLSPPLFRADVLELEDLRPGTILQGTVTNVVDFGAFVDIGVKKAGLVHISEMADGYVRDPFDVVAVGDVVTVRVVAVDPRRERISLSLRLEPPPSFFDSNHPVGGALSP